MRLIFSKRTACGGSQVDELTKQAEAQEKELEADFKRLVEEKRLCEVALAEDTIE